MFGLFRKTSEADKLEKKYKKLLEAAHQLSTSNRTLSDEKMAEANEVLAAIEKLQEN